MFVPPIFQKLQASSKNILLAGMGGGYDVIAGLPLYFELSNLNLDGTPVFGNIVLANLSFTEKLSSKDLGKKVTDACLEVKYSDYVKAGRESEYDSSLGYPKNYFVEWHLSRWFFIKHKKDIPVYAFSLFEGLGVSGLTKSYRQLCEIYNIDTIILIDAGVDSLLKGDEEGLGTFGEDLLSILAAKNTNVPYKYLMCVGLSTEGNISEYDFLENWAAVQKDGGFLGAVSWQLSMDSVKQYVDAILNCVPMNSTINSQIIGGLQAHYGDYLPDYIRPRLGNVPMFVNPLMAMTWYFDLKVVINYRKYLDVLEEATSLTSIQSKMEVSRLNDKVINRSGVYIGNRKYECWFK